MTLSKFHLSHIIWFANSMCYYQASKVKCMYLCSGGYLFKNLPNFYCKDMSHSGDLHCIAIGLRPSYVNN